MGSSKFHTLRKLVSPARHQQLHDDPSDELAMVGRSEVPVCLAADRPPAHLLQSLYSRDASSTSTGTGSGASTSASKRPQPQPLTPPRSPPRPAATANSGSGSPVTAAPPDSPLSGYRRSPVPEPIMEVDELDEEEEEEHGPLRPIDAAAPPRTASVSSRPRCSLESIPETPTPLDEGEREMGSDEALPSLTASSSSAASSLAGRPSSDEGVDIRGAVALPAAAEVADKETLAASQPVRVADF